MTKPSKTHPLVGSVCVSAKKETFSHIGDRVVAADDHEDHAFAKVVFEDDPQGVWIIERKHLQFPKTALERILADEGD